MPVPEPHSSALSAAPSAPWQRRQAAFAPVFPCVPHLPIPGVLCLTMPPHCHPHTKLHTCVSNGEIFVRRAHSVRTVRAQRPIFCWLPKKQALNLPYKKQEECVPRGVSKVFPYFEVDEYIFGLGFT